MLKWQQEIQRDYATRLHRGRGLGSEMLLAWEGVGIGVFSSAVRCKGLF